jgi:RNA polymerase sigma factor (sigma-70 family)
MAITPMSEVIHYLRSSLLPEGGELTDGQLLECYLSCRQPAALEALVRRHGLMVWNVCRRVLGCDHDAEDAFQATFLVLVRKAASVHPRAKVGNWLYGVAHQTALKARATRAKRLARERPVSHTPDSPARSPGPWDDLHPLLDQEISRLAEKYRTAIVLCELEGKSVREAARQLGVAQGTVASRLSRARTILARRLARHGLAVPGGTLACGLARDPGAASVLARVMAATIQVVSLLAAGQAPVTGLLSAKAAALTEGVVKSMLLTRIKIALVLVLGFALAAAGAGRWFHRTEAAAPADRPGTNKQENRREVADAEMHVIGVYGAKSASDSGTVEVEVRATSKPVVLVLTSYYNVEWHVKAAEGARIKKAILSGYFAQEVTGLPAGVPVENRSYFPDDGSRRKNGWFWAYKGNAPQWREMVRRLNDMTGLPVTSFQGEYQGVSFIVDGKRGRELAQKELKPRGPAQRELTPRELRAASANARLHIVGVSSPGKPETPFSPIDVDVRATDEPVVLVLTSYSEAIWNIKSAPGARIKAVIVGSFRPQEVEGLRADVPASYCCPDGSDFFDLIASPRKPQVFYANQSNTSDYRRMVEKLNDWTGLLVSTFQGAESGASFVVDGVRGREHAQKERKPRSTFPKEPTPRELLAACADAELHLVGIPGPAPKFGNGAPVDVEIRPSSKPIVLALTSYQSVLWNLKIAKGAQVRAVIIAGYFEQEFEGIPANILIVCRSYFPKERPHRNPGWFYGHEWNSPQYREMVRMLNEMTGLAVASFQGESEVASFIIDGERGRRFGQKVLKACAPAPKQLTARQLLAVSAGARMHVVGIYNPEKPGKPVEVEVRATAEPVVLVLSSSMCAVWNVKRAEGARIKALLVSSSWPQVVEGVPADVPVRYSFPDPSFFFGGRGSRADQDSFSAYKSNTSDYRRMVEKLNDLTGLLVSTFQGEYMGVSFVVDGVRGREFAQKERKRRPTPPKEPTPRELRALSAGADLRVVSIYGPPDTGSSVDVEVRRTDRPIVVALVSYGEALWRLKIDKGTKVKAVIIGGYFEQEFDGIPAGIPVVYRTYFPGQKRDYFYGHNLKSRDCRDMLAKLNELTGLLVSTFQGEYTGTSFVVDGIRGRDVAQKERKATTVTRKQADADPDQLADVADIPSMELQAGGDAKKRYFLIGPRKNAKAPGDGYGLFIIMPGGDGSADFNPFVRRIYKFALSGQYLAAQPIAFSWTRDQKIVWPTKTNPVAGMKFSTEEFVESVIEDVAKKHKLNRKRIFTLSWSSSGPAAYAISLQKKGSVTGSFIAMSVFNPTFLPPLKGAKGHAYYVYHSPGDRLCPYRMAEQARKDLAENGAAVRLESYEGGHGWRGNVYRDIRQGVEWLEKQAERK